MHPYFNCYSISPSLVELLFGVKLYLFFLKQIRSAHNSMKHAKTTGQNSDYNSGNNAQLHIEKTW